MNITRSPADAGVSLWLIVYRVHICKPLAFPAVSCYNVVSNIMHIFRPERGDNMQKSNTNNKDNLGRNAVIAAIVFIAIAL